MALATTSAVWRSTGGDSTRTAYAGSMKMVAQFYSTVAASPGTKVTKSASDTSNVILPANAVVTDIIIYSGTGASSVDFDMGYVRYNDTTTGDSNCLLNNAKANSVGAFNIISATAGDSIGSVLYPDGLVYLTAGAGDTNGGAVSGYVEYFVRDNGAENV
jgi:hypothetical protein